MNDSKPESATKRKNTEADRGKSRRFRSVKKLTIFSLPPCLRPTQDGTSIWTKPVVNGPGVWVSCTKGKEKQAIGEVYQVFESVCVSEHDGRPSVHGSRSRSPLKSGRSRLRMMTKNQTSGIIPTELEERIVLRRKLRKNLRRSSGRGKSKDSVSG